MKWPTEIKIALGQRHLSSRSFRVLSAISAAVAAKSVILLFALVMAIVSPAQCGMRAVGRLLHDGSHGRPGHESRSHLT